MNGSTARQLPLNIALRDDATLADLLPTALDLMGLDTPEAMTGQSLLACAAAT